MISQKIKLKHLIKHQTKRSVLVRFGLLIALIAVYFLTISLKYGAGEGFVITALSWSFFVLCTPIADAGFLLDFPLRLITGIRMIYSEMIVWCIAISLNIYYVFNSPQTYQNTTLLQIFHKILTHPFPYWAVIILAAMGTFLSIYFGDELLDVVKHHERIKKQKHHMKWKLIAVAFVAIGTIVIYDILLNSLDINISL